MAYRRRELLEITGWLAFVLLGIIFLFTACSTPPTSTVGVTTYIKGARLNGSGVLIHDDARGSFILTAGHAVSSHNPQQTWPTAEFYVQTPRGSHPAQRLAAFIGSTEDGPCDLGLLRCGNIEGEVAQFGSSHAGELEVKTWRAGESILAATLDERRLSTRPDVQGGDSGAGLFSDGMLVGIVNAEADGEGRFIRYRVIEAFLNANGYGDLLR